MPNQVPDGISCPFNTSSDSSQHSNIIKHKKRAHTNTPIGKRPLKSKRRVYLVESENSSDSDHVGPSERKDGVNVAQQPDSDSASDVAIGKFAVAYHTIDTNKARHYQSYSSDNDDEF